MNNSLVSYSDFSLSECAKKLTQKYSSSISDIPNGQSERVAWITDINWHYNKHRNSYINRYFLRYAKFLKYRLQDLLHGPQQLSTLVFADIGCGPGTASIALLDIVHDGFILPNIKHVIIELVDHKQSAIDLAEQIIRQFANECLRGIRVEIVTNCNFLNLEVPRLQTKPAIILCANMLCEINDVVSREKLRMFFQNTKSWFLVSDCVFFDTFDIFSRSISLQPVRFDVIEGNGNRIVLKYFQRRGNS
jgi:SAM-dependent methyltransferase